MSAVVWEWPPPGPHGPLAVLVSGGLDSAVLLAEAARAYPVVYPLYVRTGLQWEAAELAHLERFLAALRAPAVRPLHIFEQPVDDVYGAHWSISGNGVPDADSPDEAVFLPGRNVLLLAKPLIWCSLNGIAEIATAPLDANPFPDATSEFYDTFAAIVSRSLGTTTLLRILRPYAVLKKPEVIRRGREFPLEHTFSCLQPVAQLHCGACNKCAERRAGFRTAGIPDPTTYGA